MVSRLSCLAFSVERRHRLLLRLCSSRLARGGPEAGLVSNVVVCEVVEFLFTGDFPVWFPRDVYDVVGGVEEVVSCLVEKVSGTLAHIEFDGYGSSA